MNQLLSIAIQASIEAGKKILEIYNSASFDIETKADHSPLTSADKAAHRVIVQALQITKFPILSEEGKHDDYNSRKKWETFWLVDPLDGTKEFIKRNDDFTVNIALIQNQIPICGVIYIPVSKELYFADSNGSFKSKKGRIDQIEETAQQLPLHESHPDIIVLNSRSHMNSQTEAYIENLKKEHPSLHISSRGSSLKFCLIAEGKADYYPRMGPTMEWDTAAGHAIVRYAGKTVKTYPGNQELKYNKEELHNPDFIVCPL